MTAATLLLTIVCVLILASVLAPRPPRGYASKEPPKALPKIEPGPAHGARPNPPEQEPYHPPRPARCPICSPEQETRADA